MTATALAVGPDNAVRLLWESANGQAAVWNMTDPNPSATGFVGSLAFGWSGTSLAFGPDAVARLLWGSGDGQALLWNIAADATYTALPTLAPPTVANTGATFGYSANGLRVWKETGAGVCTYCLYDGSDPVCELDASGAVTAVNTFGAQGLLSRHVTSTNTSTFYTFDERGNVAQRTDATGAVLSTDLYDAYGKQLAGGAAGDPWGFEAQAGYYTDTETGLILCTHRYYDPNTGRFLTRDPIGYAGGIDLYGYTGNDPVNGLDPSGLQKYKVTDHNGSYIMDVPDSQSIDRNIIEALAWLKAHPGAGFKAKEIYVSDRVHGGANPTVGDYKDYKDVKCAQLRQERDLAGNFNFGALSTVMGFSETAMAAVAHAIHIKDTYGAAGGGISGLKAVLSDPFHPDDRQQAIEDGAEYVINKYQHIGGRNTLTSVMPIK